MNFSVIRFVSQRIINMQYFACINTTFVAKYLGRNSMSISCLGLTCSQKVSSMNKASKDSSVAVGDVPVANDTPDKAALVLKHRADLASVAAPVTGQSLSYDILQKLDERPETEAEAEERVRFARQIYDKNLTLLNKYMQKRGVWRVLLNDVGEIMEVSKGATGQPRPGEYSFIVTKKGTKFGLKFGTFERLTKVQTTIATSMKDDMQKLYNAKELADATPGRGTKAVDDMVERHLQELTKRFGDLPPSTTDLKKREQEELDKLSQWIECDEPFVDEGEPILTFEEMLAKEARRKAKKERQKARRAEQKRLKAEAAAAAAKAS